MSGKKVTFLIAGVLIALLVLILFFFTANVTAFDFSGTTGLDEAGFRAGYSIEAEENNVESIIGNVITTILSLVGVLFLVLMIYGGFMWMSDRGNEEKAEKAKKIIIAAVVGLIIVMASYAATYFVINALQTPALEPASDGLEDIDTTPPAEMISI